MRLALLQMINSQLGYLATPQSTSEQEGEKGTIAFALQPFPVRGLPKCVPLFGCQPIAQSDSQFLYTFDASDSGGQICAEEATLRRLVCQAPNRPKLEVDCTRRKVTRLEMHPITNNDSLAERQAWLGAVPVHKFINGVAIAALSVRARQAIENRGLRHLKIWQSQDRFCNGALLSTN
jgi:hypothetical protein